ncbi:hypothetical protein ES703_61569 [subsurface metagenome]
MSEITRTLRGHRNDTWTRDGVLYYLALENRFGQHYYHWWEKPPFGEDAPMDNSLRFNWFTVPAGAVIDQAYVEISARKDDDHINCHVKIRAELAADPTQIMSVDDFYARPRSAAAVLWHNVPAFKKDEVYRTPDLSTLVQELVDTFPDTRKNIQLFIENDGSDRDSHREYNHYGGWPKEAPKLYIKYNADDPPVYVDPLDRCSLADQSGCWEPWGDTLTENNLWAIRLPDEPYSISLADGLLTFSIPSGDWNALYILFSYLKWTLTNDKGQHLWFQARAVSAEGDDHFHFTTYLFDLRRELDTHIVEAVVSHGDHWGPEPLPNRYEETKSGFFFGLGPGQFDIVDWFIKARKKVGLTTDPQGWYVTQVRIALERVEEAGFQEIVSDYFHLTYSQEPMPTPPSPTKNWLITDYSHSWHLDTKRICVKTDVLCHLYLRFKDEPPEWHARVTWRRGVADTKDPSLAMQEYDQVEQEQPGDTFCHRFTLDPFPGKTRIWYYFIGTIDGGDVKSRSQFFRQDYELHYLVDLFTEVWGCSPQYQPEYAQLFAEGWTS